jgi:hypothetical protein
MTDYGRYDLSEGYVCHSFFRGREKSNVNGKGVKRGECPSVVRSLLTICSLKKPTLIGLFLYNG